MRIKPIVENILKDNQRAREDDNYLILKVIEEIKPELTAMRFDTVLNSATYLGISFESITRRRRNFLKENPELKPEKATKAREIKEEEYYLEYSRHIPRID